MSAKQQKHDPYEDDDSDFDEEYFNRTYRPLSNLPTPPPSHRGSSSDSSVILLDQDEILDSALFGPAVHLVNLIPPAASLITPSIPTVHEILERANLPLEQVALAVCILDSLDSKFARNWRLACPLAPVDAPLLRRHTLPAKLHIDTVRPEVVILAAMMIAVKFLEDIEENTQSYASRWGSDLWTCDQINVTERCIMENLGYRIMPLWNSELIDDALSDMKRAGWQAIAPAAAYTTNTNNNNNNNNRPAFGPHQRSMSSGFAIVGRGSQLTPSATPKTENVNNRRVAAARADIQKVFAGYTIESLQLPPKRQRHGGEGEVAVPPHL